MMKKISENSSFKLTKQVGIMYNRYMKYLGGRNNDRGKNNQLER